MSTYTRCVHTVSGAEKLLAINVIVGAAWTANATNYWTFQFRRVAPSKTFGQVLATYSLATRTLAPNTPAVVYTNPQGLVLNSGDRIMLRAVSTGSPAVPSDPAFQVLLQRIVR